jgi:chromosome partitioning protein
VGRHDYPFLTTCVSASSAVDNALLLYKPVAKHRKRNPVADDYLELANEILSVKEGEFHG